MKERAGYSPVLVHIVQVARESICIPPWFEHNITHRYNLGYYRKTTYKRCKHMYFYIHISLQRPPMFFSVSMIDYDSFLNPELVPLAMKTTFT